MNANKILRCNSCGNIIEMIQENNTKIICCGTEMQILEEKQNNEGTEKHIPIVKQKEDKTIIQIGEVLHPMSKEHQIEWLEIITKDKVIRKNFEYTEEPTIEINNKEEIIMLRAYCNKHGLWTKKF